MKRKPTMQEVLKAAEPILKKRFAEADEMVKGVGAEIMRDQREWLDAQMKDILPPHLYQAGLAGDLEHEIAEYMQKHQIRLIFVPDRMVLRIMIGGRAHSQFVPQLLVDGEPVSIKPKSPLDGAQN